MSQYLGISDLSAGKDRPIGLEQYGEVFYWSDRYYVLTRENLESTLQTKQPPGLLTVWLSDQDHRTGISLRGHYRMLLGIERVP